jgi:hypothetical protein
MRKDLKRSLLREQKQHQPIVNSSQAFLRRQHRLRLGRLQQAVCEIRHLCRVLLRKSLETHTSRSFRYLHLLSLVLLLRRRRRRRLCLKCSHFLQNHQHPRNSHLLTRSFVLRNRKLRNPLLLHIPAHSLAGVLRKMSGLLPNQKRKTRAMMKQILLLAARPNIWHQSCSVPWLHLALYPQWTASPPRQCKTARLCQARSNPAHQRLLHLRRRCLIRVRQLPRHLHRQCPDLQLHHRRRCQTVLRLVDRQREQLVVVEEVLLQ